MFFEIMDQTLCSLKDRFENETLSFVRKCERYVIGSELDNTFIISFYNRGIDKENHFDSKRLKLHREICLDIMRDRKVKASSLKDVVNFLKSNLLILNIAPEFIKLIKLLLVIPGSSCTCKRSFSALRRLKNYLRSTMLQNRLNSIAIIYIFKEEAKSINLEELVNEFICKNNVRKATFALNK